MSNAGAGGGDIFDVKRIRRLVELMEEHDLAEVDLRQGEQRIRLRRGMEPQVYAGGGPQLGPVHSSAGGPRPTHSVESTSTVPTADDGNATLIKSPMVGTFYSAANPDSPPFVNVGDIVAADTVVCIIEAMKVFNEIQAEAAGQVAAVLVENGQPVEFGQPLYKIVAPK
jgi:acetyl-CoA carboxylase biotin carboxyl carrier protein